MKQDTVLSNFLNTDSDWLGAHHNTGAGGNNNSQYFLRSSFSNGVSSQFGSILQTMPSDLLNINRQSMLESNPFPNVSIGNLATNITPEHMSMFQSHEQHHHQQQQQQHPLHNQSPMNTSGDDEELVSTPPTPPIDSTPPLSYQTTFRSESSLNDPFSNVLKNDMVHPSPNGEPNEYERPTKLARTTTLQLDHLPATTSTTSTDPYQDELNKLAKLDVHISFLRSQTERLEEDMEKMKQHSSQNLSRSSFLNKYAGTNTEKISQEFYNSLVNRYHERNNRFLKAKEKQIAVISSHEPVLADELHTIYTTMKKEIDEEKAELRNLLTKTILLPADLHLIRGTIEGLKSHYRIVDVLYNELQYVLNKKKPESCCAIILVQQPASQVIFRGGKGISEPFKVELVTGVVMPESVSVVVAKIDKNETTKKEKAAAKETLENNESSLDNSNRATFSNLKVNISTRMSPSYLKFVATVKDRGSKTGKIIESVQTNPLVVITNESQWSEASGKLLAGEVFEDREEVPWALFANILHSHVFTTTGQVPDEPKRKIHTWEWDYIQQNHFASKPTLTRSECKEFWTKFGPILQTIHFKRHISNLWFDGLICGFISKNECNQYLYNAEEGSFLIRFSDSMPGSFAVAYVTNDENERVKHYLVRPEEIGPNKTLPDFLRERFQFKTLYRLEPALKKLTPVPKDEAFKSFYSQEDFQTWSQSRLCFWTLIW
ncbi:hypothetical protein SAMD00019534_107600 [Acytostelium subglobosum LB1]|uniref:hypothetical protein n=1 Tax=Acytostelium subglobosum LB1 TaxID=1410327 RepID=UPI000644B294|nr:hypothetical protein SAMD00019534_107600 [Acytostelium subglobosum LB1]GAM27584.1 hypothetical protein SAMD00019534_107600 [Acytostelium subglobosum LB1]|eukprot:XP_012749649.1 hypothetical protein SAMD00019534_107600 [Acytostelium subglobosum LB1]